jgi:DNA-binding NarL/FixJ family response regulator
MRAILVGSPRDRERLLSALHDARVEVIAEFTPLAEARASDLAPDAIIMAPTGNRPFPGRAADVADDEDGPPAEPLTPREMDVLELLSEGLPNKAIADALGISDQTVKFHISSISAKLGAANRTDAVRRAVRRGLIAL